MSKTKILLVILYFISLTAYADDYISTTAWGASEQEARHTAFIKAIELKIGVLMLSDRETQNYAQVKNDIYAYSDGYIIDYETVSIVPASTGVTVTVRSLVSTSKIKNRILISNNSSAINGPVAIASFNTYRNSKNQSDALLKKVLSNYPKNAYNVSLVKSSIKSGNNREIEINIDFSIQLKPDFIKELTETLDVIENPNIKEYSSKIIIDRDELIRILSHQSIYYLDDELTNNVLYKYIDTSRTRVGINLLNNGQILYKTCRAVSTFVTLNNGKVTFFVGKTNYYSTQLSGDKIYRIMEDVTDIELSVVDVKECTND